MSRKKPPKLPESVTAPAPIPEPVNDTPKVKKTFRESWEYRSGRWLLRAVGVLLFIGYLGGTAPSAVTWAQTKWVRSDPLTELPRIADYYINHQYSNQKLHKWVALRPESETPEIIKILEPFTPKLSTLTFLTYSSRLKHLGQEDDALFWWQFTLYRARFDALRCGSVKSVEHLSTLVKYLPHPEFPPSKLRNSAEVIKSLHAVLDYDAKYPAHNNPDDICDSLRALEPGKFQTVRPEKWQDIRHSLRIITEYRLGIMEDELKGIKHPKSKGLMGAYEDQLEKADELDNAGAATPSDKPHDESPKK